MLYYLMVVVFAMVGLNYAVVPLYRTLCQTTGYGGTVQHKEVFFYIDPEFEIEFETDPRMDGINKLLSYTFFKASEELLLIWLATTALFPYKKPLKRRVLLSINNQISFQ